MICVVRDVPEPTDTDHMTPKIRLERRPQVELRSGLRRSTLYDQIKSGTFPPPIQIGPRAVAWVADEVDAILSARVAGVREIGIRELVEKLVRDRQLAVVVTADTARAA